MKFSVTLTDLHKALDKTSPAMPKKSTLPILEHFNFQLKGNELKIIATDQDLTIMSFLLVDGSEDGHVLLPGKRLNDIVRALNPDNTAEFTVSENFEIKIKTSNGKFSMKGIDPNEYLVLPELFESVKPDIDSIQNMSVVDQSTTPIALFKKEQINRIAERTASAVSKDEYRPAMTGVYFQFCGTYVNSVSTDSYRLVKTTYKPENGVFPTDLNVIIPSRTIEQLKKADNDVAMSFIKTQMKITHVRLDIGETVLISRIIEEKFPPYESVLPKNNTIIANLPKAETLTAIKRAAIFANATSNQVKLSFEANQLTIIGEDEDTGSMGSETLSCEYSADPMVIGFNHRYLSEEISNIEDNQDPTMFQMTLSEPNRPALIKPYPENEELLMLLMPVRIS